MDEKMKLILEHYKKIIENKGFDEYDILGFLIFIREKLCDEKLTPYISEFCDLIAHRERDRGIVCNAVKRQLSYSSPRYAYDSQKLESMLKNKKWDELDAELQKSFGKKKIATICNYRGIKYENWKKEWENLFNKLTINVDEEVIKEITLCIFSLSQGAIYKILDKNGNTYSAEVELVQSKDGCLGLCTKFNMPDMLIVCFMKTEKIEMQMLFDAGIIDKPVETVREKGKLQLICEKGLILEC